MKEHTPCLPIGSLILLSESVSLILTRTSWFMAMSLIDQQIHFGEELNFWQILRNSYLKHTDLLRNDLNYCLV